MDVIKLLLDGGAKVEAVDKVGPASAAAPSGARTARTTPPTATTTTTTMTTAASPSPRARNCRNHRVVTLARAGAVMMSCLEKIVICLPRVKGTVRYVYSSRHNVPSPRLRLACLPLLSVSLFTPVYVAGRAVVGSVARAHRSVRLTKW